MNESQIIQTLSGWNFWDRQLPKGKPRVYCKTARRHIKSKSNKIVVISGIRRSGKTTLARQTVKTMLDKGLDAKNTLIINFEKPAFAETLNLNLLTKVYESNVSMAHPTAAELEGITTNIKKKEKRPLTGAA